MIDRVVRGLGAGVLVAIASLAIGLIRGVAFVLMGGTIRSLSLGDVRLFALYAAGFARGAIPKKSRL